MDYPYQAVFYITNDTRVVFTGAIISDRWVITTEDFASLHPGANWRVRAGSNLRNGGGSIHQIDKVIEYHLRSAGLALVRVVEPFDFDITRQPIKLLNAGEKLAPGTMANVSGFGWLEKSSSIGPSWKLQAIEMPIMGLDECKLKLGVEKIEDGLTCIGYSYPSGTKGFYVGDESSLVVVDGQLAALVTSPKLCSSKKPSICIDIAHHRNWIDRQMTSSAVLLTSGSIVFSLLLTIISLVVIQ